MRLGGGKAYAELFCGFAERPAVGDCSVDPRLGRGQVEQRGYCLALRQRHAVGRRQCGKTAADLYCKAKGFQTATGFSKDPGLNVTVSMGDKAVCKQGVCDGFASITCHKS